MPSSPATPRLIVELATHSLQCVAIAADNRVLAHKELAADAAAVKAFLAEAGFSAAPADTIALLVPQSGFALRSNAEEAASIRTARSLVTRAESAVPAPLQVVAVDAANGQRVDTVGNSPWLLAGVPSAQVDAAKEKLSALGLGSAEIRLALPVETGAVVTALQDMPESTRVLIWEVGETDARLACVSAAGCEAAAPVAAGFEQIFEAVQAGLGLKFRAAAAKLFFNAAYDFSDTSGPIAERLAAQLRPVVAGFGSSPTALRVTGLPAAQDWLAKSVASALEIARFEPKADEFLAQCGLKGDAPAGALGLLFQASSGRESAAWRSAWLDANAAPVAAAPAPAAPVVKSVPPAAAPKPEPAPAPVPASASAAAPAAAPKPKKVPPAPAPAPAPAAITPAPIIKPAPVVKPAEKPVGKPAEAAAVASASAVETEAPSEPAAAPAVEAPARKKSPALLIGVLAAVVVLGGGGAFLAMSGGGEKPAAAPVVQGPTPEEIRMREMEEARMLAEELKNPRSFRNDRYSFEVSDRGFLRKLVGPGTRTLIDEFGWIELGGTISGTSTPFNAGTMGDTAYRAAINKTVRDGKVVFEIKGVHPRFTTDTVVTCLPDKLLIETLFKPLNMKDSRGPLAGNYMVKMTRQSLSLGQRAEVAPGSIKYATQSGPVTLKFNTDVWGQAGEEGKQTFMVGSNLVFFYFAGDGPISGTKLSAELLLP